MLLDFVLSFDPLTTIDQLQLFQTQLQRWSKDEGRQWGEMNLLLTVFSSVLSATVSDLLSTGPWLSICCWP
jgi:hypothetical protein